MKLINIIKEEVMGDISNNIREYVNEVSSLLENKSEGELIKNIVKKWLTDNYGNLERHETNKFPNHIFYMKDGEIIFDYNRKNGYCNISDEEIWSFLERVFQLGHEEIQDITKEWVEEHYKLRVTTTSPYSLVTFFMVEEHYKLRVTTTDTQFVSPLRIRSRNITN